VQLWLKTHNIITYGMVPGMQVRKIQCMGTTSFEGLHVEK